MTEIAGKDGDGVVTVYYPSSHEAQTLKRGPFTFQLAWQGAPLRGNGRLIVISHGSGGSPWVRRRLGAHARGAGLRDVVDEATPFVRADDAYGESKAAAEGAVWAAAADGLRVTVLRPSAILGAHPSCTWTVGMPKQIASGEFSLHGDGNYALPYVHVRNLADAVVLAARSDRADGQAYIVVDGHTTWREVTDLYRSWLGLSDVPSVSPATVPPAYRWHGRWSGEKLRRELGYEPRVTWHAAMAEVKAYLVETGVLKG